MQALDEACEQQSGQRPECAECPLGRTEAIKQQPDHHAFVVISYDEYKKSLTEGTIPHEVVSATVDGATQVRAWREYLRLTQAKVAEPLGIAQPSYAKQEASENLRRSSIEKIAAALGITVEQLDF